MSRCSRAAMNITCLQSIPAGLCAVQSSRHLAPVHRLVGHAAKTGPCELEARIEREVAQRTAELQEAVWRLEDFCAHVAHDPRDALGGIAGLAGLRVLARGGPVQALQPPAWRR